MDRAPLVESPSPAAWSRSWAPVRELPLRLPDIA